MIHRPGFSRSGGCLGEIECGRKWEDVGVVHHGQHDGLGLAHRDQGVRRGLSRYNPDRGLGLEDLLPIGTLNMRKYFK